MNPNDRVVSPGRAHVCHSEHRMCRCRSYRSDAHLQMTRVRPVNGRGNGVGEIPRCRSIAVGAVRRVLLQIQLAAAERIWKLSPLFARLLYCRLAEL
jgi:hypothetical protein